MAKRGNENRKTAARMVLDIFIRYDAVNADTAIDVDKFKNLKLTSAVISYTIGNLINDGVVVKTGDDRFYFDQDEWKKLEKKVTRGYWILIGVPLAALILILVFQYFIK